MQYLDAGAGRYRAARLVDGRLDACLFIAPGADIPGRDWVSQLFQQDAVSPTERMSLLAGVSPKGRADAGRIVCSCFSVGINTLITAIQTQGLTTPEAIGRALQAGTNCGSCVPELRALIATQAL